MQYHHENVAIVTAPIAAVFAFLDDPHHLVAHMSKGSWMMGGGGIDAALDEGRGQSVGSHIKLSGRAFGLTVYLDEVVVKREVPRLKAWSTIGAHRLLVIGAYAIGFELTPRGADTSVRIYIDYDLPERNAWLGRLLGSFYARLCVDKMLNDTRREFAEPPRRLAPSAT